MPPAKKGVYGPRGDRSGEYTPTKAEYMRAWREKNRDKVRAYNRKSYENRGFEWKRSLTTREYFDELMAKQGGVCAICRKPETIRVRGRVRRLHVDHDHVRGHIRGLLCSACNTGLGKFHDDPGLLLEALVYVARAPVIDSLLPTRRGALGRPLREGCRLRTGS